MRNYFKYLIIFVCVTFLFNCMAQKASDKTLTYQSISMEDGLKMMAKSSGYILLDVRRADEFASGHIPGAILFPHENISSTTAAKILPNKNQQIFVYCRSGRRSKIAAQKLIELKYTNIIEIGGINNYSGELSK